MFDGSIRRRLRDGSPLVIPVGSTEQHGEHLPVTTDTDIVSRVAELTGRRLNAVVLPAIPYGVSFEHAPRFHASVKPAILAGMIREICRSARMCGAKTIFVINGHHGNQRALAGIRGDGIHVLSYWHFTSKRFDHAGEVETSLMMAAKKRVRMSRAKRGLDEDALDHTELERIKRMASKSFIRATGNGIWGDPTGATAKKGEKILSEIVSNLAKKCKTLV